MSSVDHMMARKFSIGIILVTFFCVISQAVADDHTSLESMRIGDSSLKVSSLELMLDPLTVEELQELALAWRDSLKKTIHKISELGLKVGELSENDKKKEDDLIEEKNKLLILFRKVISELEIKGGDIETFKSYADAVSRAQIVMSPDGTFWSKYSSWFRSKEGGVKLGIQLLKFIGVMLAFWFLAGFLRRVVRKAAEKSDRFSELLEQFMIKISFRAVMIVGLIVALGTVGINVAALLTVIGGASFIIAFALQDTLSNFAAGIMLLIYRPFDVGDMVEVGGVSGKIDQVSLVSTIIRTFDNKIVLVPNKNVWGQIITNSSTPKKRRVDMIFGIGYDDNADKAKQILTKIVKDHDLVLEDPEPTIQLHELADSSVNFICRPWVKTADYWQVHWDVTQTVKAEFDKSGISIPYPHQELHIKQIK